MDLWVEAEPVSFDSLDQEVKDLWLDVICDTKIDNSTIVKIFKSTQNVINIPDIGLDLDGDNMVVYDINCIMTDSFSLFDRHIYSFTKKDLDKSSYIICQFYNSLLIIQF